MTMPTLHACLLSRAWVATCVAFVLSGCGGSVPVSDMEQAPRLHQVRATGGAMHADTKSFTLNPTSQFKGFNPETWNDDKSWYECECGDNPRRAPRTMQWNPV